MDTAIVTALAGIFGSLLRRVSQCGDHLGHAKNAQQARIASAPSSASAKRFTANSLTNARRVVMDSFENTLDKPETLLSIYALLNRIRLCASDAVLREAVELSCSSSWNNTSRRTFRSKNFTSACTTEATLIRSRHSAKPAGRADFDARSRCSSSAMA